ncbi:MAG: deoxyribonuclease IV [Acidobacteriota bacterium]|jgi:deoxyribonuclease-4|nr:deoxyribonuclease IV [Acidobacteriota bacterium]
MKESDELLVGAHLSIAGGVHRALERGRDAGCRAVQMFLKNSNQWEAKPLTDQDRELFAARRRDGGIVAVVAHGSYLINLASPDDALWQKSLDAFVEELRRAQFLDIPHLVLHPGAHKGAGVDAGVMRTADALNRAFDQTAPAVTVLLETMAGQGSSLGSRFEELAAILEKIEDADRVGVCLDTSHIFAAGYDIRTRETYDATMDEFDRLIGIGRIRVVHVNDSRKELASRVDRHFHIGEGRIGLDAFSFIVNDPRLAAVPKILETPKGDDGEEDLRNLATLRSLYKG